MSHGLTRIHTDILVLAIAAPMWAQAPKPYASPRMPDGHPNLQGTYDLATLTPLERAAGTKAVLTKEEAARLEAMAALVRARGDQAISGERQAPPKGGDGSTGPAGGVGGYNTGWLDPGSAYTVVDGQRRSSLIVDPPDGRAPPYTPEARKRLASLAARPTSDAQESN